MANIMVSVLIANRTRTGVLENLTLQEFAAADKIRGQWIILVANHKNSAHCAGPSQD